MTYPWGTARRYHAYSDYFRNRFGGRVQKVTVHGGFTCPNRDGTCGTGGCTFCNNKAFTPSYVDPAVPVADQIRQGMAFHNKRYRNAHQFLAYFQAFTNTHAPLDRLRELYSQALEVPGVIGLVVGTRPDSVDGAILDYLAELAERCYLVLEFGLESLHDHTLRRINRGHDMAASRWAVAESARRGIRTGGHLMVGLPGESRKDVMDSVRELAQWPLHSVKFHQLQVIRGTAMEREYVEKRSDFLEFSLEEYLDLMVEIVEALPPSLVVERIAGEVSPALALQPGWGLRYDVVQKKFEALLEARDSWQGKQFKPKDA
ncbi:MAG: TIGR01212 family radical SAM protein [Bacteroidales bacterium]